MYDFDFLLANWIKAGKPDPVVPEIKEYWNPAVLHASDLGKCPLQVKLRLGGEVEVKTDCEIIMLNAGTERHFNLYSAIKYAGIDYLCEYPVEMPEGWTGTCDLILPVTDYYWLYDLKTVRSNAFKMNEVFNDWPKDYEIRQVHTYLYYGAPASGASIIHSDRDGSNPSQVHMVPQFNLEYESAIREEMAMLEAVRDSDDKPPMLPRKIMWKDARLLKSGKTSGDVYDNPDWRCSYCGMESCPQHRAQGILLMKVRDKGVTFTKAGDRYTDQLAQFLDGDLD